MALLTTFCAICDQVTLQNEQGLLAGSRGCKVCGKPLRIVPGCSLNEDERELFDDLREIISERTIEADEARRMARHIAGALQSGKDQSLLDHLTGRLPGLLPIQMAVGANLVARRRVLKVLRTILEAKSLAKRVGNP